LRAQVGQACQAQLGFVRVTLFFGRGDCLAEQVLERLVVRLKQLGFRLAQRTFSIKDSSQLVSKGHGSSSFPGVGTRLSSV
jgi:hypothetical protein